MSDNRDYARKRRIISLWKWKRDIGWVPRRGWVPALIIMDAGWKATA